MSPACVSDEIGTALAVSVNTASVHTEENPPCKVWCQKLAGKQQVGVETSGSSITLSYLPLQASPLHCVFSWMPPSFFKLAGATGRKAMSC